MKHILLCLALLLALPATSLASPGAGGDKFTIADTNKDGSLTREEFAAAFPTLKPQAFGAIDSNGDSRISADEWRSFSAGHSSDGAAMPGKAPGAGMPGGSGAEKDLPLLPVPRPAPGTMGDAPLLSPPVK